jgi:hypothetical protein
VTPGAAGDRADHRARHRHRDADRIGDRGDRKVDLGGEDDEGQSHRDDAGDRRLLRMFIILSKVRKLGA